MLRYRLLTLLLWPVLLGHSAWLALRAREPHYLAQRFGWGKPGAEEVDYWIHAASVGEARAAAPLLRELRAREPAARLLLTTTTTTGAAVARALPEGVAHRYFPWDTAGAVRRFLDRVRPRRALILETEIWPQLYRSCAQRGIPLLIVNARVSPRTLRARGWLRTLYRAALREVDAVLARSAVDAEGFLALGARHGHVRVIGNIKFAARAPAPAAVPLPRPFVLAASTHEDEELRVLRVWLARAWHAQWLLVLAPRHPRRVPELLRTLTPLCAHIALHSRRDPVDASTRVYLIDMVGELAPFLAHARAVFVGGSLIPRGGQNVLEPAGYGRPVLFGPHMDNFREEAAALLAADAAREVADEQELGLALDDLHAYPDEWAARGGRGAAWYAAQGDVAARYVDAITGRCCPDSPPGAPSTRR